MEIHFHLKEKKKGEVVELSSCNNWVLLDQPHPPEFDPTSTTLVAQLFFIRPHLISRSLTHCFFPVPSHANTILFGQFIIIIIIIYKNNLILPLSLLVAQQNLNADTLRSYH